LDVTRNNSRGRVHRTLRRPIATYAGGCNVPIDGPENGSTTLFHIREDVTFSMDEIRHRPDKWLQAIESDGERFDLIYFLLIRT